MNDGGNRVRSAAFLAGVCVGLGPVVALLGSWRDIATPTFVGLGMSVLGGVVGAVFVPRRMMDRITESVEKAMQSRADAIIAAEQSNKE